jgi:hypothetical protein
LRALSSAVEHFLDMEGVRGSIPLAPTIHTLSNSIFAPEVADFAGVWPL